jgi:hypothetical protein
VALVLVSPNGADSHPSGWINPGDLGDVMSALCGHYEGGDLCGVLTEKRFLPGWRCPRHTPSALKGTGETVPDPARTTAGMRDRVLAATPRAYGPAGTTDSPRLRADGVTEREPVEKNTRRK